MKKLSVIIIAILILTVSVIYIVATETSVDASSRAELQDKKSEKESCCSSDMEEVSMSELSENSLYQLNSDWTNQFGNKINLTDLRGRKQIVTMIFANCTYVCPILVNDMRRIEDRLSKEELKNVQFTLFTIDPERDTPEKLKEFAQNQNLNLSRWQLLTSSKSDIADLAALMGFRYKKENDGSYSHSNIISILNEEGELIHQQAGLSQEIEKTLNVIRNQNKQGV
ncbi:MAG TPA: SCO family protein [Ignavibacteria bacterium]|nr:SCO family protein [Ignavibacteria bacterium]